MTFFGCKISLKLKSWNKNNYWN